MLVLNETIFQKDHLVYHLTTSKKMLQIKDVGLLPRCEDHCHLVGHTEKGICFFDSLDGRDFWLNELYPHEDICSIELLRFNLKGRTFKARDIYTGDFYITSPVSKEELEYLSIYQNGNYLPIDEDLYDKTLQINWLPISTYHQVQKVKR